MTRSIERTGRNEQIDASRHYIGAALKYDPNFIFDEVLRPEDRRPRNMPGAVAGFIDSEIGEKYPDPDPEIPLNKILRNGLRNTQTFLHDAIRRHKITEEAAYRIIEHPMTIETLAGLALQDESLGLANFNNRDDHPYAISRDESKITRGFGFETSSLHGCPFAGREGKIDVDPLFKKFVTKSAGVLAIRSYYNRFSN